MQRCRRSFKVVPLDGRKKGHFRTLSPWLSAAGAFAAAAVVTLIAAAAQHQKDDENEPDAGAVVTGIEAHFYHLT